MIPDLILASSSPQRQALLTSAGYRFTIMPPREGAECGICSRETPPEFVARLAWQKAADVAMRADLSAPNKPAAPGRGLRHRGRMPGPHPGKPRDIEHARSMLQLLSGREHRVYSGLCVWPLSTGHATRARRGDDATHGHPFQPANRGISGQRGCGKTRPAPSASKIASTGCILCLAPNRT